MSATHQHQAQGRHDDSCRLDVWLWRARFFKTRGLAAQFLEEGRVRVIRPGSEAVRVDKPSRAVRAGDGLVFAIGGRLVVVRIEALGERRGPPGEARGLYCETPH
jgi:ribosome-associated heat shock protein Hsp15